MTQIILYRIISILLISSLINITVSVELDSIFNDLLTLSDLTLPADGSGNNADNPEWNQAGTTFRRVSKSTSYIDAISIPVANRPWPRVISNNVGKTPTPIPEDPNKHNILFVIFGQFIAHDVASSGDPLTTESMNIVIPPGDIPFDPLGDPTQPPTVSLSFSRSAYIVQLSDVG